MKFWRAPVCRTPVCRPLWWEKSLPPCSIADHAGIFAASRMFYSILTAGRVHCCMAERNSMVLAALSVLFLDLKHQRFVRFFLLFRAASSPFMRMPPTEKKPCRNS